MDIGTLAQIDLLVDQGHYSNRSDFINQAVRQTLEKNGLMIDRAIQQVQSKNWFLVVYTLSRDTLLEAQKNNEKIVISGYGLLNISPELDELVLENVLEIQIKGKVRCSDQVKKAFNLK
jgi:Arc/MetJ-type ribon-helix-helix transcriptional regulator